MPTLTTVKQIGHKAKHSAEIKAQAAVDFAHQAERLAHLHKTQEDDTTGSTQAVKARFITPQDPVIETADGARLPAVPLEEATRLNTLRNVLEEKDPQEDIPTRANLREAVDGTIHGSQPRPRRSTTSQQSTEPDAPLREAIPPSETNPLFPPLPLYGPPSLLRDLQCYAYRISSSFLSFGFLMVIVLGAAFTSIPKVTRWTFKKLTFRDPNNNRPFYKEEQRRLHARKEEEKAWSRGPEHKPKRRRISQSDNENDAQRNSEFIPTEGGPDKLIPDVGYYARRVGLDCKTYDVQTEDGFIIELWHLYNPREYTAKSEKERSAHAPEVFHNDSAPIGDDGKPLSKKYPVLMIHGLLQNSGAFCCSDDDSLAFFLAKSGYDVWLGNNRCGVNPRHMSLNYGDPRMWAWNIRQMGVLDVPALMSRVLFETGFPKLALIGHSQGTTQTFVALAKEQRPEIGDKISVFCALAPAAYAGPLIGKIYFKIMQAITPAMFRAIFGIHAFIPLMMMAHKVLPAGFYGWMGYRVFSFLFNWSDTRWEKSLRNRMFQFAPVYVSAESMRWWLGRECFARQKCILATRQEIQLEDREDMEEETMPHVACEKHAKDKKDASPDRESEDDESDHHDYPELQYYQKNKTHVTEKKNAQHPRPSVPSCRLCRDRAHRDRGRFAWYDEHCPPFALWVAGDDDLVNGRRLLRRFEKGREPHVDVVHAKVIEGYEHLDVIWAMDAIEKVGKEVREVIWKTVPSESREVCLTPVGCEGIQPWQGRPGKAIVKEDESLGPTLIKDSAEQEKKAEQLREGRKDDFAVDMMESPETTSSTKALM